MVRRSIALVCVPVAALCLSAVVNCGSSSSPASTSASTSSSSGSASTSSGASTLAAPPQAISSAPTGNGPAGGSTFAISQLFLGDTYTCAPASGATSCVGTVAGTAQKPLGWQKIGYDLDGQNDTATTTNHCKPAGGAQLSTLINGDNGIDNSFAKNVLPIILTLYATVGSKVDSEIQSGGFTIMLEVGKLNTGASYNGLNTSLFAGSALSTPPKFDGTDNWPVRPELLNPPANAVSDGSQITFPKAYTANNTWVSGSKSTVNLSISLASVTLTLTINNALISFDMDTTHKHATNGIIAGVLNTQALTTQLTTIAGSIDPSLCNPGAISGILNEITAASDIGADGTQNPSATCDGISIGIGFNAELVQNPTVVGPVATPTPNPCDMDAGTGSSSSSSSGSSTSSSSGGTGGGDAG